MANEETLDDGEIEEKIKMEAAKKAKVKKEEIELYSRGINYLTEKNIIDIDEEDKDMFLRTGPDYSEVNIKMDSNGAGAITYTVMMYGSITIEFDKDGNFEKAFANNH